MAKILRCEIAALLTLALVALSAADPMILLMNAQAKCMSVESPADSLLTIEYEAPDLIMPADLDKNEGGEADPRQFRRFRTTITVSQSGGRENHHGRNVPNRRNQQDKIVKDLETKKGQIEYITKQDGSVSICVQSLTASAVSPTPISLRVSESPAGEDSVSETAPEKTTGEGAAAAAAASLDSESQQKAKAHFTQMEKTLSGLISKTEMILRQADYAKELEVEFHEQSIAMNKASQWWPIVQLCVLLVTGFTQANHMVQFFRKHHIF
mmetsp:Transcript_23283/g.49155  ORF Transcript_23283/g.49155 Transcript_23283/m.49155 type:complete len:268 (+) Transcript_23283:189-992(+)|eukprot:CAMPEP_0183716488 /NCGR_PEP_ID=MMETSP0737-20130205/10390_1 /TAXON_ID=385413 /ORGANISM="Thalassiosira miniscula, Strain CCMP1093" /LENGTH=267 /DNA_ID=CAMNT_0025945769 /DNA_START=170 /DNA_END=973 /DNA_ORIENTATION=+